MPVKQTKILIVEDDITMREIVVHKLSTNGFNVVEADNGPAAIETWKKEKPDLVLLDLMLPEMDGFQILESVRKSGEGVDKTPVIILSNLFSKEDIQKAKSLGIEDFMVKAYYTTEEILTKVNEAIAKKAMH
jgi:CheY-like chemotaxis protein